MPEVILPCPACGGAVDISGGDEWHNQHSFFIECQCGVCRVGDTVRETCIERWNDLPRYRPLTWTYEPPKVAGWYWCRECKSGVTLCVEVYGASSFLLFGSKRDDFNPQRPVTVDGIEWAGPIPAPID